MNKVRSLRSILIDQYPAIQDIDSELLLLAITKSSSGYPKDLKTTQIKTYGSSDYERLEFLGDSVLDLIVAEYLFNDSSVKTAGQLTQLRSKIVRNSSLSCFVNNKDICDLLVGRTSKNPKDCADLFESLIGALYYHLKIKQYPDSVEWIKQWLIKEWNLKDTAEYIIKNRKERDVCNFLGRES